MAKKDIKIKKRKKKNEGTTIKAMLEAKVPSASYELSVKPACHIMCENES